MWYANVVACQLYLLLCTVQKNTQLNNRFYLVKWSHNFFSFFWKIKNKNENFQNKIKINHTMFQIQHLTWVCATDLFFSCLSLSLSLFVSSLCLSLFLSFFFARFFSLNLWQLIQFNVTRCELLLSFTRTLHSFQSIFKSFNSFVFLCTHCHTNL